MDDNDPTASGLKEFSGKLLVFLKQKEKGAAQNWGESLTLYADKVIKQEQSLGI